jgi:hypothetical protein
VVSTLGARRRTCLFPTPIAVLNGITSMFDVSDVSSISMGIRLHVVWLYVKVASCTTLATK